MTTSMLLSDANKTKETRVNQIFPLRFCSSHNKTKMNNPILFRILLLLYTPNNVLSSKYTFKQMHASERGI